MTSYGCTRWFWGTAASVQGCGGAGSGRPAGLVGVEEQESQATAAEHTLHHHHCVEHRRQPGSGQHLEGLWDPTNTQPILVYTGPYAP